MTITHLAAARDAPRPAGPEATEQSRDRGASLWSEPALESVRDVAARVPAEVPLWTVIDLPDPGRRLLDPLARSLERPAPIVQVTPVDSAALARTAAPLWSLTLTSPAGPAGGADAETGPAPSTEPGIGTGVRPGVADPDGPTTRPGRSTETEPAGDELGPQAAAAAGTPGTPAAPAIPVVAADPAAAGPVAAATPDETIVAEAVASGGRELGESVADAQRELAAGLANAATELDRAAAAQRTRLTAATTAARRRVQGSTAAAASRLGERTAAQRRRLAAARTEQLRQAQRATDTTVTDAGTQVRARGQEAIRVADGKGTAVDGAITAATERARGIRTTRVEAATRGITDAEVTTAMRQAAAEVLNQTVDEIRTAVGTTAADVRRVGPEVQRDIEAQQVDLVAAINASLGPLRSQVEGSADRTAAAVDSATTDGLAAFRRIGTAALGTLTALQRRGEEAIEESVTATRAAQRQTATDATEAISAQAAEATARGRTAGTALLRSLTTAAGRREAGTALAVEAARLLRQQYGLSRAQARMISRRVGAEFSRSAAQAAGLIAGVVEELEQQASSTGEQTAGSLTAAQTRLARSLEAAVGQAIQQGEAMVAAHGVRLTGQLRSADEGLGQALGRFGGQLDERVAQARTAADGPVGTLDGRLTEAVRRARQRAEDGWLMDQLRQAGEALSNPGFWTGLIVGLLVTIAVIAICGTGIGALILAGALAGALSVAASTLTEHATGRRQGPVNWGELGRDMVVGAIFGAIGGAVGGGISGVAGRQVAAGIAGQAVRQTLTQRVAQTVAGAGVGVLQNILSGPGVSWDPATWHFEQWDRGLLLNLGVGWAMSSRPIEHVMQAAGTRARAAAVDRGLGLDVRPPEIAAAAERMQARADALEPPLVDLPEGSVGRLPDAEVTDPVANRRFYEQFVADSPQRESALLRNTATGEYAVVQGASDHVPIDLPNVESLLPPELQGRGRWVLESHSHPVGREGVTPARDYLPSGATADFGIVAHEAEIRGGPHTSEIRIETPAGPDVTRFGVDPSDPRPFSVDFPDPARPGQRRVERFATIEEYHDFYTREHGGDLGPIPADFPAPPRSDSAPPAASEAPAPRTPAEPPTPDVVRERVRGEVDPLVAAGAAANEQGFRLLETSLESAPGAGSPRNQQRLAAIRRIVEQVHAAVVDPRAIADLHAELHAEARRLSEGSGGSVTYDQAYRQALLAEAAARGLPHPTQIERLVTGGTNFQDWAFTDASAGGGIGGFLDFGAAAGSEGHGAMTHLFQDILVRRGTGWEAPRVRRVLRGLAEHTVTPSNTRAAIWDLIWDPFSTVNDPNTLFPILERAVGGAGTLEPVPGR